MVAVGPNASSAIGALERPNLLLPVFECRSGRFYLVESAFKNSATYFIFWGKFQNWVLSPNTHFVSSTGSRSVPASTHSLQGLDSVVPTPDRVVHLETRANHGPSH